MIRSTSFGIVVFINCLFIYKYSSRVTDHAWLLTAVIAIISYVLFAKWEIIASGSTLKKLANILVLSVPLVVAIVAFIIIDPQTLKIERWSVIHNFLDTWFSGKYPYFAVSHMGNPPGPMPVYYIIALPFYFFKGYSFLGALGYLLVGYLTLKEKLNRSQFVILYSILSVFMVYEIMGLSNLFTYTALCALSLLSFEKAIEKRGSAILFSCLLLGLMLSTRSVYALVYVVFFVSYLKTKRLTFKKCTIYTVLIMSVFAITFLPFILFYGDSFTKMNPFIVQSSFLVPQIYVACFFIIAIMGGLLASNTAQRFFYSGVTLFIAICIYAVYQIFTNGFHAAFIGSKIDITYFIFTVPFLLVAQVFIKNTASEPQLFYIITKISREFAFAKA